MILQVASGGLLRAHLLIINDDSLPSTLGSQWSG